MLRKLLSKLLNKHSGSQYRPRRSSDDYENYQKRRSNDKHNQYGHQHYKKKRSSSSYSS
ncbi:hypothetical protein [Paenibacillus sp. RC67]|uniref:hypothetical protein n=1 Tax=Paenibacillus sp. RC67 TaxID=3039392 RepID=UPI0024AE22D2|nr:hypothetical protein [Paenibacillus sp. RC67]